MLDEAKHVGEPLRRKVGFTLVELLVVIAVISLLMATLLPALGAAKRRALSIACQAQLRNIAVAWKSYLLDNDDCFYQGINANHNFGGWEGQGGYGSRRPLNKYLGMPMMVADQAGGDKFLCPADNGRILGQPAELLAYDHFGNSYQTNLFLIGPDRVGEVGKYVELHKRINFRLNRLRFESVDDPVNLLLVGDNNWILQWHPFYPDFILPEEMYWHGLEDHYNMAFLDGRVDLVKIEKGIYVQEKGYRVMPFRQLDRWAYEAQK
ncbi:MAG: type II secretion system protein [Planctomycetes bacterium]|nr:type II secretion system protein [Planctomycetota bacterium]